MNWIVSKLHDCKTFAMSLAYFCTFYNLCTIFSEQMLAIRMFVDIFTCFHFTVEYFLPYIDILPLNKTVLFMYVHVVEC